MARPSVREQLVEAAAECFHHRGFNGTGIQDIALAAVIYGRATQRGVGTPLPDFPYLKKS